MTDDKRDARPVEDDKAVPTPATVAPVKQDKPEDARKGMKPNDEKSQPTVPSQYEVPAQWDGDDQTPAQMKPVD